jgi:hypothetical protein
LPVILSNKTELKCLNKGHLECSFFIFGALAFKDNNSRRIDSKYKHMFLFCPFNDIMDMQVNL